MLIKYVEGKVIAEAENLEEIKHLLILKEPAIERKSSYMFKCPDCEREFKGVTALKIHKKKMHNK